MADQSCFTTIGRVEALLCTTGRINPALHNNWQAEACPTWQDQACFIHGRMNPASQWQAESLLYTMAGGILLYNQQAESLLYMAGGILRYKRAG
jgi:hypothetical protein